jgi:hypothetical protein
MIEPKPDPVALRRPKTPRELAVQRDRLGRARLRWRGSTAGDAVFVVQRRVTDDRQRVGAWTTFGQTRKRGILDEGEPAGASLVEYRLRAERLAGVSTFCKPVVAPEPTGGWASGAVGRIGERAQPGVQERRRAGQARQGAA